MPTFNFRGLIAPVFTPFNDDINKSLNLDIVPHYVEYLVNAGISGVLVNGTSGEGTSLTVKERKLIAEAWIKHCSQTQQHVMVQVGGASLPDVIELSQHAEQCGADSLLCLPELYHKPTTSAELIRYLKGVAQAAPNTPLLYYHIPMFTNVNINMGVFLKEVSDQIPTFSGIKFTSTVLDEGMAALNACSRKFAIFLGADTVMVGAYALGFNSAIATTLNIFPYCGQQILESIQEGSIEKAQEFQNSLNIAIQIITNKGTWVPAMKAAMNLITSVKVGPVREPLEVLTEEQLKQMELELQQSKLI